MMHWAYVLGRAVGAALHELATGFSKPSSPEVVAAEEMTPDLLGDSFEGAGYNYVDDDMDWLGWAVPAISEVLAEHADDSCDDLGYADWIDHVAPLIAERTACDPARAITALWNTEMKRAQQ